MAIKIGHPFCTEWKNYQYKMTRAIVGTDYTEEGATSPFDSSPPTIWMNDDHVFDSDSKDITYGIVMSDTDPDTVNSLHRQKYWVDATTGLSSTAGANIRFQIDNGGWDTSELYSLSPVYGHVIDPTTGLKISLITMQPGLMLGLPHENTADEDAYSGTSAYQFTLKNPENNCLHNKNKLMNNCNTCWIKYPETPGNSVATETLPNNVNNYGFNVMWNINRNIIKKSSGDDTGINIFVQGSTDKTNWLDITQLTDDPDIASDGDTDNFSLAPSFDTHELGGGDFPYKRLRFETLTTGTPAIPTISQWIQIGVTPTN